MSDKPTMHTLQYGNTAIEYALTYTDRETLAIHVHTDTRVAVEAPLESEFTEIEKRVRKRAAWIVKQQRDFRRFSVEFPPRKYVSGETHRYLGRQYRLRVIDDDIPVEVVRMDRGIITLFVSSKSPEHVKQVLEGWLRERARKIFTERVEEWYPRFERFEVQKPQVVIRNMRSRWGQRQNHPQLQTDPGAQAPDRLRHRPRVVPHHCAWA
jgi:predicted metal-dependent hydrolase